MADIPKVVSARLGAAAFIHAPLAAAHPETDMLSAFAEQALSVGDRDKMLGHLALCADCREVVALALPPDPIAASLSLPAPLNDFHEQDRSGGRLKDYRSREVLSASEVKALSGAASERNSWFGFARPNLGWAALAAGVAVAASMLVLHPVQQRQATETAAKQIVATAQIPTGSDSGIATSAAEPTQSKTVARLNSKAAGRAIRKSFESTLEARNVAPIAKAKPALRSEEAVESGNQPTSGLNSQNQLQWDIADGILRRSSDGGENWESVLRSDPPVQCYASHDRDVWAGGQSGTLFHSTDAGQTWAKVNINARDEASPSDIAHIDVRWHEVAAADEIVISNKAMERWSSLDGGASWQKK